MVPSRRTSPRTPACRHAHSRQATAAGTNHQQRVSRAERRALLERGIGRQARAGTGAGPVLGQRIVGKQIARMADRKFLWTARAEIAPLLHVPVKDSLVGGQGSGQVALLSAVPVASADATLEMNSGSLHRFLAEAVWLGRSGGSSAGELANSSIHLNRLQPRDKRVRTDLPSTGRRHQP